MPNTYTRAELASLTDRTNYPGIDPSEARALRAWIRRYGDRFDELRFNVRVGAGVKLSADTPADFAANWAHITKMRLDLVGWNPPHLATLAEVKVVWANDAVWQLLSYRDAYRDDHPDATIDLIGICEAFTPQARALADSQGITLYVFQFPSVVQADGVTGA